MCLQARRKNWKEAGWTKWSGNKFQSSGAALKATAAEEEVRVRPVNKFADRERRPIICDHA